MFEKLLFQKHTKEMKCLLHNSEEFQCIMNINNDQNEIEKQPDKLRDSWAHSLKNNECVQS